MNTCNFLGDAYLVLGRKAEAEQAWRRGWREVETVASKANPALGRGAKMIARKLGQFLAKNGNRAAGLDMGRRAWRFVDPSSLPASKWPPDSQKILAAEGAAMMGYVLVELAKSPHAGPSDRDEARNWLGKALRNYQALEGLPTYTNNLREQMRSVRTELENLK